MSNRLFCFVYVTADSKIFADVTFHYFFIELCWTWTINYPLKSNCVYCYSCVVCIRHLHQVFLRIKTRKLKNTVFCYLRIMYCQQGLCISRQLIGFSPGFWQTPYIRISWIFLAGSGLTNLWPASQLIYSWPVKSVLNHNIIDTMKMLQLIGVASSQPRFVLSCNGQLLLNK